MGEILLRFLKSVQCDNPAFPDSFDNVLVGFFFFLVLTCSDISGITNLCSVS